MMRLDGYGLMVNGYGLMLMIKEIMLWKISSR